MTSTTLASSLPGLRYDGHGALSAGASSRLLFDYAEPARGQILDFLFKPSFGANLHVCKVEIGGDTQSTDGTEPSHQHGRGEVDCSRGYEFWLMKEARRRNPEVVLVGLPWGAPGWVNNQSADGLYGADMIGYTLAWLSCARDVHGLAGGVDWLGLWNEKFYAHPTPPSYVKQLRQALDADGFSATRLMLVDGGVPGEANPLWQAANNDTDFNASFDAVGDHYPCEASHVGINSSRLHGHYGKALWASEDWWSRGDWGGAACLAKIHNQNFLRMNISATVSWSMVWSVYNHAWIDPFQGDGWGPGLIYAWQPWSGSFNVTPVVWAAAHTTQFVHPGWRMPWAASGTLAKGGSYVSYVSPDDYDFAVVLETAAASCAHCAYGADTAASVAQQFTLTLGGTLVLHPCDGSNGTGSSNCPGSRSSSSNRTAIGVWRSNASVQFERLNNVPVGSDGTATITVEPGSIYTLASAAGHQTRGAPTAARPATPFPATWADDFEVTALGAPGRYWADQCGSFEVVAALGGSGSCDRAEGSGCAGGGGGVGGQHALGQRVTERPGTNRWDPNLAHPITVLGGLVAAPQQLSAAVIAPIPPTSSSTFAVVDHDDGSEAAGVQQPQNLVWAGICGRVSSTVYYRNISGVCLQLLPGSPDSWRLVENVTTQLGAGALPPAPPPSNGPAAPWRTLSLQFLPSQEVVAWANDAHLGSFAVGVRSGMFGLASGWNKAQFDRVDMRPLPSPLM